MVGDYSGKYRPVRVRMNVISPKCISEGIPMPLMYDMLFEDSFRQSV